MRVFSLFVREKAIMLLQALIIGNVPNNNKIASSPHSSYKIEKISLYLLGGLISSCISNENDAVQSMLQNIDLYKPASNWSDSFDWQLLKVKSESTKKLLNS